MAGLAINDSRYMTLSCKWYGGEPPPTSKILPFHRAKMVVVNFILLWISARLDNELNFFVEYIIRLNQPDIYNNYINLVCFETLNLNS